MEHRYKLEELIVEITRRCNKNCAHCMKGDSQNTSISKAIIDKIFDDIDDVMYIGLGTGEVLLEIPMVEYFIQKLIDSTWSTGMVEFTTNGTVCDKKVIDILELFCLSKQGRYATMRISNDQFHDAKEYRRAYEFYKPLVDAVNAEMQKRNMPGGILLTYTQDKQSGPELLLYEGKAIPYIDNKRGKYRHGKNVRYPFTFKHRVKIVGDTIPCMLYLSANGDIGLHEEASYDGLDSLSFGNILNHSATELIDAHNGSCLLLCSEADCLHSVQCAKYRRNVNDAQTYMLQCQSAIHNRILELRYKAHELFPHVPAQHIIDRLPFPSTRNESEIVIDAYKNCPDFNRSILDNLQNTEAVQTMCKAVLAYINNRAIPRKHPYELFGSEDEVVQSLVQKFATLDRLYKGNPNIEANSKVYLCDRVPGGVSYDVDTERIDWGRYMEELERMAAEEMQEQYSDNSQRKEML